jgi:hypothetical protein
MINNLEQVAQTAVQVYYKVKSRIKELYRLILEASDRGESFTHLHEELVMLESIIKDK